MRTPTLDDFVAQTKQAHGGRLASLASLMARRPSAEDWVDGCVVGGVSLLDALAGRVTDVDLDPAVLAAFHGQYPNLPSFVERVQQLEGDPEALRGLVSGVKGKLFEQEYAAALNDSGALPDGYVAELAESPTQAGFDLAIYGPNDAVAEQLQLKATASADYLREAIERYPDFEVVVPSDVYADLASHADLAGHVVDSGVRLSEVEAAVHGGLEDAAAAAAPDLVPELAFLFIAASAAYSVYKGKNTRAALSEAGGRLVKAGVAGGLGGLAAFAIDPFVGLPVALVARLAMGRRESSATANEQIVRSLERIEAMRAHAQSPRPQGQAVRYLSPAQLRLLAAPTPAQP